MNLELEILFNQFAQEIFDYETLENKLEFYNLEEKKKLILDLENLIIQSKSTITDLDKAIDESKLKETFTPCVILKKGVHHGNFIKISNLPENELGKALKLLLFLFKQGYTRRFQREVDDPNKWWYWNLSNKDNIEKIKKMF